MVFALLLISSASFAQSEEFDEFDILQSPVEINSSKEGIRPESPEMTGESGEPVFEDNNFPENTQSADDEQFDLSEQPEEKTDNETVLVKTREEPDSSPTENSNGLVEVRAPVDVFLPYKQRQGPWGFLFSLGAEQTKFPRLLTQVGISSGDDNSFEDLFGKNGITMLNVELGPKYNTSMGSFAVLGGYGYLNKKDSRIQSESEVTFTRYSVSLVYYLDTLFKEPYFVPYVGGGMWQADYRETSEFYPDEVGTYTTEPGVQWRFGALFGLDWIEEDASRVSRRKNGTQGTFLNVYAISTMMSEKDPDPNLENDLDLGASLIVEF